MGQPQGDGANSDMPYIFHSVKYFLDAGVAPSKLVLGLAAYGRTYTLSNTSCATAGCSFSGGATGGCAGAVGIMPYFSVDEYVQSGTFNSLKFRCDHRHHGTGGR
jgi:chitinase